MLVWHDSLSRQVQLRRGLQIYVQFIGGGSDRLKHAHTVCSRRFAGLAICQVAIFLERCDYLARQGRVMQVMKRRLEWIEILRSGSEADWVLFLVVGWFENKASNCYDTWSRAELLWQYPS